MWGNLQISIAGMAPHLDLSRARAQPARIREIFLQTRMGSWHFLVVVVIKVEFS